MHSKNIVCYFVSVTNSHLMMGNLLINGEKFMTPKDYAKHRKKSFRTIYNWISEDKIETKKILGKTLIKV